MLKETGLQELNSIEKELKANFESTTTTGCASGTCGD